MNYDHWIAHFEINRRHRREPAWETAFTATEGKRAALARSLAEYQLGDGGGECKLIAHDAESVRGSHEKAARVVDLWFLEEKEHSRLLTHAVNRVRGTFLETTFAFRLFCRVRRWFGVQFEMLVLLIVEIVSVAYYRVIQAHCDDQPIADMCGLILRDELGHITFHRDRLGHGGESWREDWWRTCFHILGHSCATFLWLSHGGCLRELGGTRTEFFAHVRHGLAAFLQTIDEIYPLGESLPASAAATAR